MEEPKKRGKGRPEKTDEEKLVRLRYGIKPAVMERFTGHVPKAKRSEFVEEALILMLDIKEGKRKLPPLE